MIIWPFCIPSGYCFVFTIGLFYGQACSFLPGFAHEIFQSNTNVPQPLLLLIIGITAGVPACIGLESLGQMPGRTGHFSTGFGSLTRFFFLNFQLRANLVTEIICCLRKQKKMVRTIY